VNPIAIFVWIAGFLVYALAGQPPWLLEHLDFVSWVPSWATHIGGTVPGFIFSFVAYLAASYVILGTRIRQSTPMPTPAEGT
jgi:hypothetical protein